MNIFRNPASAMVLSLVLVAPGAFAGGEPVDIAERLSIYAGPEGPYHWAETGQIDLDGDGDLDLLMNVHENEEVKNLDPWYVYFAEDGQYVRFPVSIEVPMFRENLEFRRVRRSNGQRALFWYDPESEDGKAGMFRAFWYTKADDGTPVMRSAAGGSSYMLPAREDEITAEQEDLPWSERGLKVEDVLINYRKYFSKKDVREAFPDDF